MKSNRHPFFSLFLNIIPGLGHFYLERFVRAFLYGFGFAFAFVAFIIGMANRHGGGDKGILFFFLFLGAAIWTISTIDMILHLILRSSRHVQPVAHPEESTLLPETAPNNREKNSILLLSFIPGLPHFKIGMMTRGLTTMILFFGSIAMIFFVAILTDNPGFLMFLFAIPILWFYSLFDALQQWDKKTAGIPLQDRSFFEDYYENRQIGKRNRTIATLFAIFPGAGHFYLGLQKRGLQLMSSFLFSIYILDVLRLTFFLFFIPIIWFYSFFDALQLISKDGEEHLEDKPIFEVVMNYRKWIGFGLLAIGAYYLSDKFITQLLYEIWPENVRVISRLPYYLQSGVVALILLVGGFILLLRKKKVETAPQPTES